MKRTTNNDVSHGLCHIESDLFGRREYPVNTTFGFSLRGRYWFPASSQKQAKVLAVKHEVSSKKGGDAHISPTKGIGNKQGVF